MPTQKLLRLLLLLRLTMRIVLNWQQFVADLEAEVWSKSKIFDQTFSTRFGQEFEVKIQARF